MKRTHHVMILGLAIVIIINSMIFAAPYLQQTRYAVEQTTDEQIYPNGLTSITSHKELLYTVHAGELRVFNSDKIEQWSINITTQTEIAELDENPIEIIEITDDGIYLFYITGDGDERVYTLGLFDRRGIIRQWQVKSYDDRYFEFVYEANLYGELDIPILVLYDIEKRYQNEMGQVVGSSNCEGSIYQVYDDQLEVLKESTITRSSTGFCTGMPFPEIFGMDNKLIIGYWENYNTSKFVSFDATTNKLNPYTKIEEHIATIKQQDDAYHYLGYYVVREKLYHLWGWNTERPNTEPTDRRFQIMTDKGIVTQIRMDRILPQSEWDSSTRFFSTDPAYSSQSKTSIYSTAIFQRIDTVQPGSTSYGIVVGITTQTSYSDYLLEIDTGISESIRVIDLSSSNNTGESNFLLSMEQLDSTLIFNYHHTAQALQIRRNQLHWYRIDATTIAATIDQTSPWLKYGLGNLVALGLTVILLVRIPRQTQSDELYPSKSADDRN